MKISNLGVTNTPLSSQQVNAITGVGEQAPPAGVNADASVYTPSAELVHFVDLVRQQPEVRMDQVHAATQRYHQGDYQTPAAADQTAAAMLVALD